MTKTVVGLFDNMTNAQSVVQDLANSGFSRSDISVVAADSRTAGTSRAVGENEAAEGAATGATGGAVLGGALGLLVGLGVLAIPGIGPVLAAGPLAAAIGTTAAAVGGTAVGAGIGAAAGGLLGGLIGAGVPEQDAHVYAESIRRGGSLVMVTTSDDMADEARRIMQNHGVVNVDERGTQYRQSGWTGFNKDSEPYRRDDESLGDKWNESSKVGTGGGAVAGAATGAAAGAVGGPVGAVVGGVAGAAVGAGLGAGADAASEGAKDEMREGGSSDLRRGTGPGYSPTSDTYSDRTSTGFDTFDSDFRTHYGSHAGDTGYTYDQYTPVYRYGYNLASDQTYAGRDWTAIEPEARRRWEERNPGTWEQFKESVHYAWERARSKLT